MANEGIRDAEPPEFEDIYGAILDFNLLRCTFIRCN